LNPDERRGSSCNWTWPREDDLLTLSQKEPALSQGIVYILTNAAMPGFIKIGLTQQDDVSLNAMNAALRNGHAARLRAACLP
jgi:hypothetical protein